MKRWTGACLWAVTLLSGVALFPLNPAQAQAACAIDAHCDDGLFCNGQEICAANGCRAGQPPCPGWACDETVDLCLPGKDPKAEAGWARIGGSPEMVVLANRYESPVVVAGVHYAAADPPLVVRVRQVTAETLELYLQNPSGDPVPERRVSYLVVEEGAWEVEGLRFEAQRFNSTVTDREGQIVGEAMAFLQPYTEPVVVGQVMSARDSAWSVFWAGDDTAKAPPQWTAVRAGKTVGADPDPDREEEVLGFVVFESGHGRLGAAELEAGVTGVDVLGLGSSGETYRHSFRQPFSRPPQVAVASAAGLRRTDSGWAVVPVPFRGNVHAVGTVSAIPFAIDEDQLGDAERDHAAEQVAYVVFDRAFSFQKSPLPPAGATFPGGSQYPDCAIDEALFNTACSAALPEIGQHVAACEQTVDGCASVLDTLIDCQTCLGAGGPFALAPILSLLRCAVSCGPSLFDYIDCRDRAATALQNAAEVAICTNCNGLDCGNRYGLEINVDGLQCGETASVAVQCDSDSEATLFMASYVSPQISLPGWCLHPDRWEVNVAPVIGVNGEGQTRTCRPARRTGPPGGAGPARADFDCSCTGAECAPAPDVDLRVDVGCMPRNSWFKIRTRVTNSCGLEVRQQDVRVDAPSPGSFPLTIKARPGETVSTSKIEGSVDPFCNPVGNLDLVVPGTPPNQVFSVAQIQCTDNIGIGGCDEDPVQLTGMVAGDGLEDRPEGVGVNLIVAGSSELVRATSSSFSFQMDASPGDPYSVSIVDPVYSYGPENRMKSVCRLQGSSSGIVPVNTDPFQVATVECYLQTVDTPPEPPTRSPIPSPFDWGSPLDCFYNCPSDPEEGGSGDLYPCDPCVYCRDPEVGGNCPEMCYCTPVTVVGNECNYECLGFFNFSPGLTATATAAASGSTQLTAGDVLGVSASATDGDGLQGFIVSVDGEFVDQVMASGTSASFQDLHVDTRGLAVGEHMLEVIALDDHASQPAPTAVEIPFRVDPTVGACSGDGAPPTLSITAPAAGASLVPGPVQIQATAADAGTGVKQLKFWVNGQLLGTDLTAPYSQAWTAVPGTHTLKVKAWDHCNNTKQKEITVTVADPCGGAPVPTVSITNYSDGQWVDPGLFYFQGSAQDFSGTGIDRVEFQVSNFSSPAVDETAPYSSTGYFLLSRRAETITARAYDGCGRVGTETITIHVSSSSSVCGIDQGPPTVEVAVPTEGAVLAAGPVTVRADAADDGVLLAAVLEVDGVLLPESTVLSHIPTNYVWTWEATPGPHVIRVKAIDVCMSSDWSPPRTFTVQ